MGSSAGRTPKPTEAAQERRNLCHERFIEIVQDIQKCLKEVQCPEPPAVSPEAPLQDHPTILDLPEQVAEESKKSLLYTDDGYGERGDTHGPQKVVFMNLTELQRLNLHALRKQLADIVLGIITDNSLDDKQAKTIRPLMSDYCNALRDYDYMKEKYIVDSSMDPFYLITGKRCDHAILGTKIQDSKILEFLKDEKPGEIWRTYLDGFDKSLMGGGRPWVREKENRTAFVRRFWFGLAGGLALIAPMLIIILHDDRTTAVTTASVATLLFAAVTASYHEHDASPLAVVGATAAYAAVLVVLVSTAL
ncbi:hypothetical protein CLAIMM_08053 [Cladophialophora immunda]|nr:hypothetical protein CLAIMM_08053 [Cladophialophora immunda]